MQLFTLVSLFLLSNTALACIKIRGSSHTSPYLRKNQELTRGHQMHAQQAVAPMGALEVVVK